MLLNSIPPNEKVNVGSTVNIVVSKGSDAPDQTEDPDRHDQDGDEQSQYRNQLQLI